MPRPLNDWVFSEAPPTLGQLMDMASFAKVQDWSALIRLLVERAAPATSTFTPHTLEDVRDIEATDLEPIISRMVAGFRQGLVTAKLTTDWRLLLQNNTKDKDSSDDL